MQTGKRAPSRGRRALTTEVRIQLRQLNGELSVLHHVVGARLKLRDVDLECLDLIQREGPVTPSGLASRLGLHPATLTGILDRLHGAGWIVRERDTDAADRRTVQVRARPDRIGEIFHLYGGMLAAMDGICSSYTVEELQVIAGFLDRVTTAAQDATAGLPERDDQA